MEREKKEHRMTNSVTLELEPVLSVTLNSFCLSISVKRAELLTITANDELVKFTT